jgi:glycolate oxidase subunit GlcD
MTGRQNFSSETAERAGVVARAVRDLETILGPSAVLADPLSRRLYARDASMIQGTCSVVTLPSSAAEVAACITLARRYGLPVVPRGAGSGLAGGATPLGDAVVVATTRLRTIRSVSVDDRVAWVEAGVLNLDLKQRLAPLGLTFAPDPASEACSTVGGNVATNAGGPRCLLRGVTRNHVRAVDVVLANGQVVRLGSEVADPDGYDLRALMVGSEGTLGIVTSACVALTSVPTGVRVILAGFPSIESAAACVSEIVASGVSASAIELMDKPIVQVIEAFAHAGYPLDAEAVVLTELDGPAGAVADQSAIVLQLMAGHGAMGVTVAEDADQRARLWKGRKSAQGAITRIAPDFYQYDCAVPRTRLVDAVIATRRIAEQQGLVIVNVFHAGDGNLHPFIVFDRRQPGTLERVLAAAEAIAEACVGLGGVLSGEHGIGLEKRDLMGLMLSRDELQLQHAVRKAFDPYGLLNPGKVLPDLTVPAVTGGQSTVDHGGGIQ